MQVSLGPHHPLCQTLGADAFKHVESSVRKQQRCKAACKPPTVGNGCVAGQSGYVTVQLCCN